MEDVKTTECDFCFNVSTVTIEEEEDGVKEVIHLCKSCNYYYGNILASLDRMNDTLNSILKVYK